MYNTKVYVSTTGLIVHPSENFNKKLITILQLGVIRNL